MDILKATHVGQRQYGADADLGLRDGCMLAQSGEYN